MRNNREKKYRSRKLRLPAALILSLMLVMAFSIAPVSAVTASNNSGSPSKMVLEFTQTSGSDEIVIKDIDYDRTDREVEFEFKTSVKYKNPKVKITRNGKNYAKGIKDKDSHELEVKVKKLTYGKTYHYKITGIKSKNGKKYRTLKGTFRAVDD